MWIFHICVGVSFQDVTTVLDFNSPAVLKFAAVHKRYRAKWGGLQAESTADSSMDGEEIME